MKKYAKVALKKTYCTSSKESRKLYDIAFGYLLLFEIPHILPQIGIKFEVLLHSLVLQCGYC